MSGGLVRTVWYGTGARATLLRGVLWPLSLVFRVAIALRNTAYDLRLLQVHNPRMPVISVGNLTVGGTGKTPVSAWVVSQLLARGARPAVVLRGYGADEPEVHARLNPGVPILTAARREAGIERARAAGANIVVLDDAFQHRRVGRSADLVLVAAERGLEPARMLPAGPFREPVASLRRATLAVVTRKTADWSLAERVAAEARRAGAAEVAILRIEPRALVHAKSGEGVPLASLAGRRVLLVTGVAEPGLVAEQLAAAGALVELQAFPDHHAFSDHELRGAAAVPADFAVCTLKDAVKVSGRWPGPRPLWYLSQQLTVERGEAELAQVLDRVLATVTLNPQTAG